MIIFFNTDIPEIYPYILLNVTNLTYLKIILLPQVYFAREFLLTKKPTMLSFKYFYERGTFYSHFKRYVSLIFDPSGYLMGFFLAPNNRHFIKYIFRKINVFTFPTVVPISRKLQWFLRFNLLA